MNKITLFVGAAVMIAIGITFGRNLPAQVAVGLGLLWIGVASI